VALGALSQLRQALAVVRRDERVALLGAMQALFESSMYAFVFLWTPALGQTGRQRVGGGGGGGGGGAGRGGWGGGAGASTANDNVDEALPHGLIFAIFMLASMLGAAIAGRLMERADRWARAGAANAGAAHANDDAAANNNNDGPSPSKDPSRRRRVLMKALRVESYMQGVYAVSALSMAVPAACHWRQERRGAAAMAGEGGAPLALGAQLLAFCAFEVATGAFWPSMMRMRAQYLPEAQRSTLMALFRAPLSAAVCLMLWRAADVPLSSLFALCSALLLCAALCQRRLARLTAEVAPAVGVAVGGAGSASTPRADEEEGGLVVVLLNGGGGGGAAGGR
jgi:hypothetical protein